MIYFKETAFGRIGIEEKDGAVTKTFFAEEESTAGEKICSGGPKAPPVICDAFSQLEEYFNGTRKEFTVPLAPEGTVFMKSVWTALRTIPYGKTAAYKEIAALIGRPKAYRAVGNANNKNPIAVFIPCHRIIGTDGKLVGYAGGTALKKKLLILENEAFEEK